MVHVRKLQRIANAQSGPTGAALQPCLGLVHHRKIHVRKNTNIETATHYFAKRGSLFISATIPRLKQESIAPHRSDIGKAPIRPQQSYVRRDALPLARARTVSGAGNRERDHGELHRPFAEMLMAVMARLPPDHCEGLQSGNGADAPGPRRADARSRFARAKSTEVVLVDFRGFLTGADTNLASDLSPPRTCARALCDGNRAARPRVSSPARPTMILAELRLIRRRARNLVTASVGRFFSPIL